MAGWYVYMLECADKTLYTGITNNLDARLQKHENGTGAKYTRGRAPLKLVYQEAHETKGAALRRELEIKSLPRLAKINLGKEKKMKKATIYGIKNCDTMKKAFQWLDQQGVAYDFHDYKKATPDADVLKDAFARFGWENVINRKGTTWRGLPEDVRDGMTEKKALKLAAENPSVIKRPLIVAGGEMLLGFDASAYATAWPKAKQ